MKSIVARFLVAALFGVVFTVGMQAQVPEIINYQGRVVVDGTPFTGTGQFKFALVDAGTDVSQPATATATVTSGFVTGINVDSPGVGYVNPPGVTIEDTTGTGATATAVISGGMVTEINVTSAGSGYSASPVVTIVAPPAAVDHVTYWSNDDTSVDGSEPSSAVSVAVNDGLFSIGLGDTSLANMNVLPAAALDNEGVHLRIWFNDGVNGFAQLKARTWLPKCALVSTKMPLT
jgi:hypothetical protein